MDAEWIRDRLAEEDVVATVEPEAGSDRYHVCVASPDRDRAKAILDADEREVLSEETMTTDEDSEPKPMPEYETDADIARARLLHKILTYSFLSLLCFPLAPVGVWYLIRLMRMPGNRSLDERTGLPVAWIYNIAGMVLLLFVLYQVVKQ